MYIPTVCIVLYCSIKDWAINVIVEVSCLRTLEQVVDHCKKRETRRS